MFESDARRAYRLTLRLLITLAVLCYELPSGYSMASTYDLTETPTPTAQLRNVTDKGNPDDTLDENFLTTIYNPWSNWTACNRKCVQSRKRTCKKRHRCGESYIKEKRTCKSGDSCPQKRRKNRIKLLGLRKNGKLVKQILYKILYGAWTPWSQCSKTCKKERRRNCIQPVMCGDSYLHEERDCRRGKQVCRKQYILRTYVPAIEETQTNNVNKAVKDIINITMTSGKTKSSSFVLGNLTSTCGVKQGDKNRQYRVVGGQPALKHSWPWQVAILEKYKDQFCGGTLIAPQWVLTAAHCIRKKRRRRKVFVRLGEHNINAYDDGELKLKIIKDIPHPNYNFDKITNDIALLKLEKKVYPSQTIDYACLPDAKDKLDEVSTKISKSKKKSSRKMAREKTMCYIIGWGKQKNTDPYGSTWLREAQVPLVDRQTCQKAFDYVIHSTQICAGSRRGGIDSCAGDSGGPLLCEKKDSEGVSRWVVYGVTSYGEGCGEKKKYGIYTNVRKYLDWINEVISSNP